MNDHSNITILKEIAELLNEETEMIPMLRGALHKFLNGTKFDAGWIFFINEKGKAELVAHENLPEALSYNKCEHLKHGGCWCVSRYRKDELKRASNIFECQRIESAIEAETGNPEGITHHATVPLQSGQGKFGILNVASKNTIRFSEETWSFCNRSRFSWDRPSSASCSSMSSRKSPLCRSATGWHGTCMILSTNSCFPPR